MRGPIAILSPISKSHPFDERKVKVGPEEDPLKIGRAVQRFKANVDNGIFDCKVLSRNHAVMWYKEGEFFLRDTKSSNGTFVNNERLATAGSDSEAKVIYTGDIIQFGVEIVENTNKVAHGCIYAMLQLFDAEGEQVLSKTKSVDEQASVNTLNTAYSLMNNHQLFQVQQYLSEAMYREQARSKKIRELEDMLETVESSLDVARKAVVNEDRLLSRIEALEVMLAACGKTVTGDKLREDLQTVVADKAKFEEITKESLRRAQEDKAEADLRLADIDRSLVNTEEESARLRKKLQLVEAQLNETVETFDTKQQEHSANLLRMTEAQKEQVRGLMDQVAAEERRADDAVQMLEREQTMEATVRRLTETLAGEDCSAFVNDFIVLYGLMQHYLPQQKKEPEPEIDMDNEMEHVPDPESPKQLKEEIAQENGELENAKTICNGSEATVRVECSKCAERDENAERDALVRTEVEEHLKLNLVLQGKVRELETALANARTSIGSSLPMVLEMDPSTTVSSSPKGTAHTSTRDLSSSNSSKSSSVIDVSQRYDHFIVTAMMLSLAPLLAVVLLIFVPLHQRICSSDAKKDD